MRRIFYVYFNKFIFSLNGVDLGRNVKIFNKLHFFCHRYGKIKIGDNFILTSGDAFNPLCKDNNGSIYCCKNARLSIGENVGMSSPVVYVANSIYTGNHVNIGAEPCYLIRIHII